MFSIEPVYNSKKYMYPLKKKSPLKAFVLFAKEHAKIVRPKSNINSDHKGRTHLVFRKTHVFIQKIKRDNKLGMWLPLNLVLV